PFVSGPRGRLLTRALTFEQWPTRSNELLPWSNARRPPKTATPPTPYEMGIRLEQWPTRSNELLPGATPGGRRKPELLLRPTQWELGGHDLQKSIVEAGKASRASR